jgi:hypothetical protein
LKAAGKNSLRDHLLDLGLERPLRIGIEKKGFDRKRYDTTIFWTYSP